MKTNLECMKETLAQERELQFPCFNNKMGLDLGLVLVRRCQETGSAMTIDITVCGQQVFHYSCDGTLPDNDEWVKGKINVVNRLRHSSYYVRCCLEEEGTDIEARYHISAFEYRPYGGCFPLVVKNAGFIGTVTVSGLPQEEDHAFVVAGIREYLDSLK